MMSLPVLRRCVFFVPRNLRQGLHSTRGEGQPIGFIGLGHMGSKMVENMKRDGRHLLVYDASPDVTKKVACCPEIKAASSVEQIANSCEVVFSMLPNDKAVSGISEQLLNGSNNTYHISCSTISPVTSRSLAKEYEKRGKVFIASPVFARPKNEALFEPGLTFAVSKGVVAPVPENEAFASL